MVRRSNGYRRLIRALVIVLVISVCWMIAAAGSSFSIRRGQTLLDSWNPLAAQSEFERALSLRPNSEAARLGLLSSLEASGDLAEAKRRAGIWSTGGSLAPEAVLLSLEIDRATGAVDTLAADILRLRQDLASSKSPELQLRLNLVEARFLYGVQGRSEDAIDLISRTLENARRISAQGIEAEALRQRGVITFWFGSDETGAVSDSLVPALALFRRTEDLRGEARTLGNIAHVQSMLGNFLATKDGLVEALEIAQSIGDHGLEAKLLAALARMYLQVENYELALAYFQKSLTLSDRLDSGGSSDTEVFLAGIDLRLGNLTAAEKRLRRVREMDSQNPVLLRYRLGTLADVYIASGNYSRAETLLREGLDLDRRLEEPDPRYSIWTQTRLAGTLLGQQRVKEAELAYRLAQEKATEGNEGHWLWILEHRLVGAEIASAIDHPERVLPLLEEAATAEAKWLGEIRSHLGPSAPPGVYERLFRVLLGNPKTTEVLAGPSVELALRFEVQRRLRELRNFASLAQAPEPRPQQQESQLGDRPLLSERTHDNEVNSVPSLAAGEGLLIYLPVGTDLFALVATRSEGRTSSQAMRLPTDLETVHFQSRLLRSLVFESDGDAWRGAAATLDDTLFRPLESAGLLNDVERLGILAPAAFENLPFSTLLRRGSDVAPLLIQRFALFYPTLTRRQAENPPRRARGTAALSLGFGISSHGPLPSALEEARGVASTFRTSPYLDSEATEAVFKERAPHSRLLHVATHAIEDQFWPTNSFLDLAPTSHEDGRLTVAEIAQLRLTADLVILAGCQTAASRPTGGQGNSSNDRAGFVEAFLLAGADRVLASTSSISDRATATFITAYVQRLHHGPIQALAEVQRHFLTGSIQSEKQLDLRHPRHWAPFVLVSPPSSDD